MGQQKHVVSLQALDRYEAQFRALHKDWHYLYKLVEAHMHPRAEREALEGDFIRLKGRIACDYPVLAEWRSGGFGAPAGISTLFSESTTLKSLTEGMREGGGRAWSEWQLVDEALGRVRQTLIDVRLKSRPGKSVQLPSSLFAPHSSLQEIEDHESQLAAFQMDWRRLRGIMEAFAHPGADRSALELELIQLKNKISCDYPTLPRWFGGRDELSTGLGRFLAEGASLEGLAAGLRAGGRIGRDWLAVEESISKVRGELGVAREHIRQGKSVNLVDDFFVPAHRRPYPWRKILRRVAVLLAVVFCFGTAWALRTVLGVGAPGAGEGIVEMASMEDGQKAVTLLAVMNESFRQNDLDRFMTVIASDFEDDAGNGRRALRAVLAAYQAAGHFEKAWVDWDRAEFTRQGDWVHASPVVIRTEVEGEEDLFIRVGLREYRGGRWLIARAEGYN